MSLNLFTVNGKTFALTTHVPLRVGDWRRLEAKGVTMQRLAESPSITDSAAVALYAAQKADPSITAEDVDQLTIAELTAIVAAAVGTEGVNRPTGAGPSPSGDGSAGALVTSTG